MLKRFMVYGLWFMVLAFFAVPSAFAQTPVPFGTGQASTQSSENLPSTVYRLPSTVSPVSPLYTDLLVSNLFHSFSCLAIGQSMIDQPCLSYLKGVPVLSKVNTSGGALGGVTSVIGMLYQNPPVRTADYLASIGQDMGIVKTANAQVVGSGQAVLNPILRLWQVSRNISYVFMIIIFVIIGMMVMFRNKLNPQTVITAQAALPGLVIGLIMITFSFFLAGLISDMAFVGTNIVGYYFAAAQGPIALVDPNKINLVQRISNSNIMGILGQFSGIIQSGDAASFSGTIFDALGDEAKTAVRILVFFLSSQFLSPLVPTDIAPTKSFGLIITPIVSAIGGLATNALISPLLGQLLSMAAALALVLQMFKLLFKLITAWLTIIFLTITAPFQLLFASLPGRQGMATGWMLSILGNILIFPAVIAVIYFVAFLLGPANTSTIFLTSNSNNTNTAVFTPTVYAQEKFEIVGQRTFPLFGGINLDFVKILLAFGALMALPTIPDIVTKAVGKAGQAGQMIGQEIMGGSRFGQGYAQKSYMGGLDMGQNVKKGILGESQIDAGGNLMFVRQGLARTGTGEMTKAEGKGSGSVARWFGRG